PDDVEEADSHLKEMVEGKIDSFQSEKRYVRKDGGIVWGRLTASIGRGMGTEPPFIIGMIEDITSRVQAVEALRKEQEHRLEFYRRTIMAATDGKLIITDCDEIEALDGSLVESWDIVDPDSMREARHMV